MAKKVCLVLGAGAGIGGTVAKKFAKEGYYACLCRRSDQEGLNILIDDIKTNGGEASGFMLDATEEGSLESLILEIISLFYGLLNFSPN
jgi:NAD(P)-dependent dehydrogenase (short-subunit alcohol dehydrogenase family)